MHTLLQGCMAQSKKADMREYWEANPEATSSEVAAEFDTNPSYARRCKPDELKGTAQNAPGREIEKALGRRGGGAGVDAGSEKNPLAELVIEDTHDEYECSDCGEAVEYLDDECSACGESLIWARGVNA